MQKEGTKSSKVSFGDFFRFRNQPRAKSSEKTYEHKLGNETA